MKNITVEQSEPQTITLAELCEALEKGAIQAQIEDNMYIIRSRDLLRLTRARTLQMPVPAISMVSLMRAS